jgi:hypothetical protein
VDELTTPTDGDRCAQCGRTDVDGDWVWVEVRRLADEDCEFDEVDLAFCSQAHAADHLRDTPIDWQAEPALEASGVRADRFFLGCGLLAIVLSVIGLVALLRWVL